MACISVGTTSVTCTVEPFTVVTVAVVWVTWTDLGMSVVCETTEVPFHDRTVTDLAGTVSVLVIGYPEELCVK